MWETICQRLIPAGAHAQVSVHSWHLVQPLCLKPVRPCTCKQWQKISLKSNLQIRHKYLKKKNEAHIVAFCFIPKNDSNLMSACIPLMV